MRERDPAAEERITTHPAYQALDSRAHSMNRPIVRLIVGLLIEAPKRDDADREAVQCHVLLRGQIQPLYGSLSYTDDGLLKLMTPSKITHENQPERTVMLEQFFGVGDVAAVMVEREMKIERSKIILG